MQTTPKSYTDIDYESFPIADLTLAGTGSNSPPPSCSSAKKPAARPNNKSSSPHSPTTIIILVPADPTYSPFEEELWPLINGTIHQTLQPHPEVFAKVVAAVDRTLAAHRGWRNPFPTSVDLPSDPKTKK